MAIIGPCKYDDRHRLLKPLGFDITRASSAFGSSIPGSKFRQGYYHTVMLQARGRTFDEADRKIRTMAARFFREAETVRGFIKIDVDKRSETIYTDHSTNILYKIVYAVEYPEKAARRKVRSSRVVAA